MCGVAGIINLKKNSVEVNLLEKMQQSMHHRGPDDSGLYVNENVGLAFVRLSILELTQLGHQPMLSDDNRYVIVFNGEIYNYIELRDELIAEGVTFKTNSDTEVLLKSFLKWGESCQNRFNGMWVFVIYDSHTGMIFISRDRFGIKPFYYYHDDDRFIFASEIPALLKCLPKKPTANKAVIYNYLVYNRTDQTEETFFSEIKKLQHGHQINLNEAKFQIKKWYDLEASVCKAEGFKSAQEYKELLTSSVNLCLRSDVPVGVCLSGGLDSSSITSIMSEVLMNKNINTFSAIYQSGQTGDESAYINLYKEKLMDMHFIKPESGLLLEDINALLETHPEPIPSTSPYAQYKLMQLASKHVKVTLDGQGADEQLAGYHDFFGFYYKELLLRFKLVTLLTEIFSYLKHHKSWYAVLTFFYFLLPKEFRVKVRLRKNGYLSEQFVKSEKNNDIIAGQLYGSKNLRQALINHFEYKLEHLLKWEDCNSMRFSVEARVPFLDYRLVEKTLASSNNWKIRKGITKYILREAMTGVLPERIRLRNDKIGFETPQDEWFRKLEWQNYIKDILTDSQFINRNIINSNKALALFDKHVKGEINISKDIWKWIHLELWFRKFID